MVGVSPSLISQIERGQSQPSVATLFALAESLDVPVDAFFLKEGNSAAGAEPRPKPEAAGVTEPEANEQRDPSAAVPRPPRRSRRHQHPGRRPVGAADPRDAAAR